MQCSKEIIARLFYNVSSSFHLLFLFFYLTSIFISKSFNYICSFPFLSRNDDEYEFSAYSEEEEEQPSSDYQYYYQGCMEKDHLVADIIGGGQELSFLPSRRPSFHRQCSGLEEMRVEDPQPQPQDGDDDDDENEKEGDPKRGSDGEMRDGSLDSNDPLSAYGTPLSESEYHDQGDEDEKLKCRAKPSSFPVSKDTRKIGFVAHDYQTHLDGKYGESKTKKLEASFTHGEKFLSFAPPNLDSKRFQFGEKGEEEIFGETNTVGSTSKSSSEWRSSINCRDPAYDPFSSSSRRSCPKWESYTVFQKYDEEMLFLDRISVQKLHETESLRSAETHRSSLSEKIIYKLALGKRKSSYINQNPYRELEAAYVAQICLTWEALNWNYKYFHQLRASRRESDPGCPAYVAQQFQQFQVLLQRYIENEPYENGRRPVVYARIRSLAPKLLQVPEYRDCDDEKGDEYLGSRISSDSFLVIMEEAIRTFMNFLKADKENHCHILSAFFSFKRNRRSSIDPTLLLLLKKVNHKKKMKLSELRRSGKCLRRKRRLKEGNEMEILMALIDLKVVSRVLRMSELSEEQMHWCEDKMTKVKVCDGKLQRDSSPLFFPAH